MSWRYLGEYTIHAFRCLLTLVLSISRLLGLDIHELLSHYRTWGPCARTCINLVRGQLNAEQLMRTASIAASNFATDPRKLSDLITLFDSEEASHVLFALRPEAHSREVARVQVPTNHLNGIIALAVAMFAPPNSLFFSA